jgi:hypothetical protein
MLWTGSGEVAVGVIPFIPTIQILDCPNWLAQGGDHIRLSGVSTLAKHVIGFISHAVCLAGTVLLHISRRLHV